MTPLLRQGAPGGQGTPLPVTKGASVHLTASPYTAALLPALAAQQAATAKWAKAFRGLALAMANFSVGTEVNRLLNSMTWEFPDPPPYAERERRLIVGGRFFVVTTKSDF